MDFLFDNPLANMPGVPFLIFYSLFGIFALVIFSLWKSQADKTANLPLPAVPPNVDPYEIAYLRGGLNEVARAVVFALRQKDFLIIQTADAKHSRIHRNPHQTDTRNLNQIERAALEWFAAASREPKEMFQSYGGLTQVLEPYCEAYRAHLEQQSFLTDRSLQKQISQARNLVLLLIFGLGGYKFVAALINGYWNVFGIIIVFVILSIVAFAAGKTPRLTSLGKIYLERLQTAFENLKYQPARQIGQPTASGGPVFAGVDPLLLGVGVFGGAILAGTAFDDYNQAFQRAQNQAAASAGGGGSSCGSACGSSCSSGGGDGGGSSCGGGCGGCGGGD
jgi:uncharacterized protein (TIGR04222 family)